MFDCIRTRIDDLCTQTCADIDMKKIDENEEIAKIEKDLISRYSSSLLSIDDLSQEFKRSREAVRLLSYRTPKLHEASVKIGRQVRYRAAKIAEYILSSSR